MAAWHRTIVLCVSVLCLAYVTYSQTPIQGIRTTKSQYITTQTFAVDENTPISGSFRRAKPAIVGDYGFFVVGFGLIRADLTQNWTNANSFLMRSYNSFSGLAATLIDPTARIVVHSLKPRIVFRSADLTHSCSNMQSNDKLILISETPVLIGWANYTSVNATDPFPFIPQVDPGYPAEVPGFIDSRVVQVYQHPNASSEDSFYIVADNGVAKIKYDLKTIEPVVLPDSIQVQSSAWDYVNRYFYLGTSTGQIFKLKMNETDFSQSEFVDNITIINQPGPINFVGIDITRNYLYAATYGPTTAHPPVVWRINATLFKLEYNESKMIDNNTYDLSDNPNVLHLTDRDMRVNTGDMDGDYGILILATGDSSPRYVQIDLPGFTREYGEAFVSLATDVGKPAQVYMDVKRRMLLFAGASATQAWPQVNLFRLADSCEADCYGNGICNYRECECGTYVSPISNETLNYLQPWCQSRECEFNCNGHGVCTLNSTCSCNATWTGEFCDIAQCPFNCSGNGICIYVTNETTGITLPDHCECNEGFGGEACNEPAFLPCHRYTSCQTCSENPACGWCDDTQECLYGTVIGPQSQTGCRYWRFQQCDTVTELLNWILTGLMGLMAFWNAFSFMLEYTSDDEPSRRQIWYRYQRSYKAWLLLFQFQLIGSLTFLATPLPSIFVSFTRVWSWTLFAVGFPWRKAGDSILSESSDAAKRSLLNIDQYLTYSSGPVEYMLPNVLFWFAVVLVVALLLFLLSLIVAVIRRRAAKDLLAQHPIYIALKVLDLAYYPLVLFSCVQIAAAGRAPAMAGLGVAIFLVIGIGYPVFVFVVVRKLNRELFQPKNKIRFFGLHGHAPPKNLTLAVLPLVHKLALGMAIGFLSTTTNVAQLVVAIALQIAWVIAVIARKEIFSDYMQRYIEVFLGCVNIASYAIVIAFVAQLTQLSMNIITIVFIVLQFFGCIATMVFYLVVWLQGEEIYSCKQCRECMTCKRAEDPHKRAVELKSRR